MFCTLISSLKKYLDQTHISTVFIIKGISGQWYRTKSNISSVLNNQTSHVRTIDKQLRTRSRSSQAKLSECATRTPCTLSHTATELSINLNKARKLMSSNCLYLDSTWGHWTHHSDLMAESWKTWNWKKWYSSKFPFLPESYLLQSGVAQFTILHNSIFKRESLYAATETGSAATGHEPTANPEFLLKI